MLFRTHHDGLIHHGLVPNDSYAYIYIQKAYMLFACGRLEWQSQRTYLPETVPLTCLACLAREP